LKLLNKFKYKNAVEKVIEETLSFNDLEKLQKGRSKNETKEILSYMMKALFNIKKWDQKFDTDKFFDEVILTLNRLFLYLFPV
jgi:guanylate kinase